MPPGGRGASASAPASPLPRCLQGIRPGLRPGYGGRRAQRSPCRAAQPLRPPGRAAALPLPHAGMVAYGRGARPSGGLGAPEARAARLSAARSRRRRRWRTPRLAALVLLASAAITGAWAGPGGPFAARARRALPPELWATRRCSLAAL